MVGASLITARAWIAGFQFGEARNHHVEIANDVGGMMLVGFAPVVGVDGRYTFRF